MKAAAASDDAGEITCSTNLDGALYHLVGMLVGLAADTGLSGLVASVLNFAYGLVTFEHGATMTISLLMLCFSLSASMASFVASAALITLIQARVQCSAPSGAPSAIIYTCVYLYIGSARVTRILGSRRPSTAHTRS